MNYLTQINSMTSGKGSFNLDGLQKNNTWSNRRAISVEQNHIPHDEYRPRRPKPKGITSFVRIIGSLFTLANSPSIRRYGNSDRSDFDFQILIFDRRSPRSKYQRYQKKCGEGTALTLARRSTRSTIAPTCVPMLHALFTSSLIY